MSDFNIFSPLGQFEVVSLLGLSAQILGIIYMSITNFSFYVILTLIVVLGFHLYADNESNLILNK